MIGVIGSEDSVRRVAEIAEEMNLQEPLVTRGYRSPEEAPRYAAEIDPLCRVILFTGRVPHALVLARTTVHAITDYIPHSGVDLFRVLVMLMRDFEGNLPTVSIDTIDRAVVRENFAEIGERPPEHVFDLGPLLTEGASGVEVITEFHERLHAADEVEMCITCLASVRDALVERGVPVLRVEHTSAAVRDSLQRASLTSRVQALEAAQVAIVGVATQGTADTPALAAAVGDIAAAVDGEVVADGDEPGYVVTTRGAVERAAGSLGTVVAQVEALPGWLAVGYGDTLEGAREQAAYARTVAAATKSHQVVLPDGSTRRLTDGADTGLRVREIDPDVQAWAQQGGISPMTLARLQAALATLGRADVTAKELSRAYGVEPRSARRLLNALAKAGLAEPLGAQSAPRAGRPQLIYRINLDALVRADAPTQAAQAATNGGGSPS